MQYIHPQNNEELIQWANSLMRLMRKRGNTQASDQIAECLKNFQKNVFTIAVIGKAKRGKSTLINALLGRRDDLLAPIDKLPASSAITRFRWGNEEKAEVFYQDGRSERISWNSIRNYVTEEFNRQNQKAVSMVTVEGPLNGLRERVELVDTPGAASIHEHHDAILHAFIPQADAVIFIVTARMPFDNDELELLQHVKKADISKIFFVINRVDEIDEEEDLINAIQHNQALLRQNGIECDTLWQISAKYAFMGKPGSGLESLTTAIENFIARERISIQRKKFVAQVSSIVEPETQAMAVTLSSLSKTAEEIDQELKTIQAENKNMEKNRLNLENKFNQGWNDAVNAFQRSLPNAENAVRNNIQDIINNHTVLGVSGLVKKIPTLLVRNIEQTLQPITDEFENKAQQLCNDLHVGYPAIEFSENNRLVLKPHGKLGTVITALGGIGAAAGGATLISAGATAAAGIAAANASAAAAAAAAATAATAAAEATFMSTVLSGIAGLGTFVVTGNPFLAAGAGGVVSAATAGAGTAATAAAGTTVTYTATPLWVALSGPVGWTIVGIGVAAVPLAWAISKSKQKAKIQSEVETKISEIFNAVKKERIPELREMSRQIISALRDSFEQKKTNVQQALEMVRNNRPSNSEVRELEQQSRELQDLMDQVRKEYV